MLGVTEMKVSVPIYNEMSVLSLTGDSNPVLLSVGGMLLCSYILSAYVEVQTQCIKFTNLANYIYSLPINFNKNNYSEWLYHLLHRSGCFVLTMVATINVIYLSCI